MPVQHKILSYTLKVWLTSVLMSPLILLIINNSQHSPAYELNQTWWDFSKQQIAFYFFIVLLEAILSFLTWLLFLIIVVIICLFISSAFTKRILFTSAGVFLTVLTFAVFEFSSLHLSSDLFYVFATNCLCIGFAAFIYKIELDGKIDITDIY